MSYVIYFLNLIVRLFSTLQNTLLKTSTYLNLNTKEVTNILFVGYHTILKSYLNIMDIIKVLEKL